MYSPLDFKNSANAEMVKKITEYIDKQESLGSSVSYDDMILWLMLQFEFNINLEYELWLVDNVGIDVAVNMCIFYNRSVKFEKFFCRGLAKKTYGLYAQMFVERCFKYGLFKCNPNNYGKMKRRVNEFFVRLYTEPEGVNYGHSLAQESTND